MRKSVITLSILGVLLVPTACSDPATTKSTSGSEGPTKVVYQPVSESMSYIPQLLAFSEKKFAAKNMDVKYNPPIVNAGTVAQIVAEGRADFGATGSTGPLSIVTGGRHVDVIGVLTHSPTAVITLRNDVIKKLNVSPDAPIEQRVKALKGLTIASQAPGSSVDVLLRQTLRDYGLDPDKDVTIQPIENQAALVSSAKQHQTDGYMVALPLGAQGATDGWGTVWVNYSAGDVPKYAAMPYTVIIVNPDFAKKNPQVVKNFMDIFQGTLKEIDKNPDDVKQILRRDWFKKLDQTLFDYAFKAIRPAYNKTLMPDKDGYATLLELTNTSLPKPVDVSFEDYFDLGAIRGAQK